MKRFYFNINKEYFNGGMCFLEDSFQIYSRIENGMDKIHYDQMVSELNNLIHKKVICNKKIYLAMQQKNWQICFLMRATQLKGF